MRRFLVGALLLLSTACGDDSTSPIDDLSGTWSGSANAFTLTMLVTHDGTDVVGSADYTGGPGAGHTSFTGTFERPTLSIAFDGPEGPVAFEGTTTDGRHFTGVLTMPAGGAYDPFVLTRE